MNADRSAVLIPVDDINDFCPADIANSETQSPDGVVNLFDLLTLLDNWDTDGPGDITNSSGGAPDGVVNIFDLLALLDAWGPCMDATTAGSPSLEYEVTDAGLTMDDWDDFEDVMLNEPDEKVKANWNCWMKRYLTDCSVCPACPDVDPFQ